MDAMTVKWKYDGLKECGDGEWNEWMIDWMLKGG